MIVFTVLGMAVAAAALILGGIILYVIVEEFFKDAKDKFSPKLINDKKELKKLREEIDRKLAKLEDDY